jgi:hypothetical protein
LDDNNLFTIQTPISTAASEKSPEYPQPFLSFQELSLSAYRKQIHRKPTLKPFDTNPPWNNN